MPNSMHSAPLIVKIGAVVVGALFALTLTGDIKEGHLRLSFSVLIKLIFSAYFGFVAGDWISHYMGWENYSYTAHSFLMMMCSVFGMLIVGTVYQAIQLSTTNKTLSEIIKEIKDTFKQVFK